jgi:Asp-tRNA(Asn)/Glu-tRNA(Gln) amidotransferase A subunit family amidase
MKSCFELIRKYESSVRAFVDGTFDEARVMNATTKVQGDKSANGPLAGMLLGVKDIINVDGLPTRCGSTFPQTMFQGPEASCVTRLCDAGAVVVGKTVTAEFAVSDPGPTRNPRNLEHTPGGSSSGSAAAVAAGFCHVAIGTQTSGSVIRPAGYCGVVGYKPSFDRIDTDGVFPFSTSMDHVGLFTPDIETLKKTLPFLVKNWKPVSADSESDCCIGIPEGSYMSLATANTLAQFSNAVQKLEMKSYPVKKLSLVKDIAIYNNAIDRITYAELYRAHAAWYDDYRDDYGPLSRDGLEQGKAISSQELQQLLEQARHVQLWMQSLMRDQEIDVWLAPVAPDIAPRGLASTGDHRMNAIWSYTGLPVVTIPIGVNKLNLPYGVQIVGRYGQDERLLQAACHIKDMIGVSSLQNEWELN